MRTENLAISGPRFFSGGPRTDNVTYRAAKKASLEGKKAWSALQSFWKILKVNSVYFYKYLKILTYGEYIIIHFKTEHNVDNIVQQKFQNNIYIY